MENMPCCGPQGSRLRTTVQEDSVILPNIEYTVVKKLQHPSACKLRQTSKEFGWEILS